MRVGNSRRAIKKHIKDNNIDISHFCGQNWQKSPNAKPQEHKSQYTEKDILVENCPMTPSGARRFIRRNNLIPYKCEKCGCDGNWQDGKISLELDHINGNNNDNRKSNIRYLCPNCHAMTETYRGKNKKKKNVKPD